MMKVSNNDPLFSGFPGISTKEWEDRIIKDLKGADYERKLIWNTPEGFRVKPYYRQEDLDQLGYLRALPGEFPFIRGYKQDRNDWIIRQDLLPDSPPVVNQQAKDAISRGARAIGFDVREITSRQHMETVLAGIDLTKIAIHFYGTPSFVHTLSWFLEEIEKQGIDTSHVAGSIRFDPIAQRLAHGSFCPSWEEQRYEMESLLKLIHPKLPFFKVISITGNQFQDAGSTLVEELAFSLATGNEYLAAMTDAGFESGMVASHISFTFALGQTFFMEIAKLRAARLLWSTIVNAYAPNDISSCRMDLHCVTARWNMSLYDPYVNLLRSTTEGMSGALGNADSITILPFDLPFEKPGPFAERIARNQQLIFKEEAHLDKVSDPSGGSYLVENLTHSVATHAWDLFRTMEETGGIIEAIGKNAVQDRITISRTRKEQAVAQRTQVMIGTNQYPNLSETMGDKITVSDQPADEPCKSAQVLTPFRASAAFDQLRLATENYVAEGNKHPSVFLFTAGNLAMLRARAGFSTNFFGCAGFNIIDNPGFRDLDKGVEAALASGAEMVVICSSDDEYPIIVPPVATKLKAADPRIIVIVAGYPKEILEELKNAGVDGFIHVRSNLLEELQAIQLRLGIHK